MENLVYFAEEVNPVFSLVALVGRVLINTCKKYWNSAKQPLDVKNMDVPGSSLAPCFYPQKASDNYLRLCKLITMVCGDLFRDILSRYIKPADLRSELDNNKQKLVNIFNKQQQNLIYPATGNTSLTAKDFDIPIIYILLRNICNIPSHRNGWGNPPANGDNSIAASIEIIRLKRNSILAHSTNGMIEDPMFEKHWKELRNVVVQIETQLTGSDLYKRGVDFLHSCNLTSVGTETYDNGEKSKQDGVENIYDERSTRFAEFFDEIAESVPVEKITRLKDLIQNSCKAEAIASLKQAVSARDCLRYLRDTKLFTSSDVIFVQYLFKRMDCKELFEECYRYAEEQDALCFYEKPPANGYQNVLFHVKGKLADYSLKRTTKIKETVAVLLKCSTEEILIGGACPSTSFLLVLSIKEAYSCKLLALEQREKDMLTKLDIDYIVVDLTVINLEHSEEFGWNIYFDPKHFNHEKDGDILLQEDKSTVSLSQHITTVFKETKSSTDEDSNSEIPEVALKLIERQQSVTYGNNQSDFDDSGEYTISVANAFGQAEDDIEKDVKANTILFISGPVVISSKDSIQFQTIYPPDMDSKDGKWFKTNFYTISKLKFGAMGLKIYTSSDKPTIQKIELENAEENKGAYQLILGTTKSNIINVKVDDSGKFATEQEGNCLRFFLLQTVSGDAMRIAMDKMPDGFSLIWQTFTNYCKEKKGKWLEYIKQPVLSTVGLDYFALYAMFRNATTLPKPKRGWGQAPDVNDTNIEDDVERIHLYRKKISHANSEEMTTEDFNASVLDLIGAIRRLSGDDEHLIKKICEIINKVFCKGKEMEKMMEDLKDFRKLTAEQEKLLKEYEDKEIVPIKTAVAFDKEIVPIKKAVACDKNLIHITGLTELYLGETAMFTAYIDSKVSTLSEVVWQRIDHQGTIYKIDVNDGKYKGSIVTFPSPRLYIHFVRKEDEGTYRLCVDTFNEEIQSSIELKVKKGECDDDSGAHQLSSSLKYVLLKLLHERERNRTGNDGSREIGFHRVHDFNISLLHNNAIARKTNGEDKNGICFTDRPVAIGEKIYIRVAETYAKWSSSMDFGLTNKNPNEIEFSPNEHASLSSIRKRDTEEAFNYLPDFNDVICFMLNSNATLSFSINDIDQPTRRLKHVSIHTPVWFSFDLYGKTRAIEISKKKPKNKPYNSFFREYSF